MLFSRKRSFFASGIVLLGAAALVAYKMKLGTFKNRRSHSSFFSKLKRLATLIKAKSKKTTSNDSVETIYRPYLVNTRQGQQFSIFITYCNYKPLAPRKRAYRQSDSFLPPYNPGIFVRTLNQEFDLIFAEHSEIGEELLIVSKDYEF